MIEGGLDTLDKVEAGDVDAEDALEFGVKIGEENTGAAAGTMVRILCLKVSLHPLRFSLTRETDKNDQSQKRMVIQVYMQKRSYTWSRLMATAIL